MALLASPLLPPRLEEEVEHQQKRRNRKGRFQIAAEQLHCRETDNADDDGDDEEGEGFFHDLLEPFRPKETFAADGGGRRMTIILQTSRHIRRYEIDDIHLKDVVKAMETFKKDYYTGPVNAKLLAVPDHRVVSDLAIPYEDELSLIETVEPVILSLDGRLLEAVDQPPAEI